MRWHRWVGVGVVGFALVGTAPAQQTAVAPDVSVGAALRSLAQRAHDVFVGQVESITRKGGVVEIAFRVEQSVAGSQGSTYTLREWAGRWPPGMHRYTVGEHALVFLRAAGEAGLSTPVDGAEGVVPVVADPDAAVGAEPLLDVRRLAARVQRTVSAPLPSADAATMRLADAKTLVATCHDSRWREPVLQPLPPRLRQPQPGVPGEKIPLSVASSLESLGGGVDVR